MHFWLLYFSFEQTIVAHQRMNKTPILVIVSNAISSYQVAKAEPGNKSLKGGNVKEGIARCTFEDRILMSDIVFLRAWTQVDIPRFYNPVTTALQPHDQTWKGMRTVAELRIERNLPVPYNKDSVYKVCEGRCTTIFSNSCFSHFSLITAC